jgi:ubiquinone/menaquinone biosynthesis C-methylase UbiE
MAFLTPEQMVKQLYLRPGDRVADIGCGGGAYTVALAHQVGDIGQVFAVDVHREMLHTLADTLERQKIQNVDVVWADIERHIPIDAYSLDAVVLSNVLFQLANPNLALEHIAKCLKPEGQLLIVEWSDSHGGVGPHGEHVVDQEYAEQLVHKHEFRILKHLHAGDYHYAFIAIAK